MRFNEPQQRQSASEWQKSANARQLAECCWSHKLKQRSRQRSQRLQARLVNIGRLRAKDRKFLPAQRSSGP
eukprot:674602-Pyramimonas_sp.AAC.1